jgi:hypothetical protein
VVAVLGLAVSMLTASMVVGVASPASARALAVTATPDVTSVEMGQRITITGTIKPGKSGQRVTAELFKGGKWRAVKVGRTTAKGAYTLAVLPIKPGGLQLRVSAKDSNGKTMGSSAPFDAVALQWHYLSDMAFADASNSAGNRGPVQINGQAFPQSLMFYMWQNEPNQFKEYDLKRSCTTLQGTVGIADNTHSSSTSASIGILADGASLFSQTFAFGQSAPVNLAINDHLRLRLESTRLTGVEAYAGFGDMRVLCAF